MVDALRVAGEVRAGRAAFADLVDDGLSARPGLQARAEAGARRFRAADRIAQRSAGLRALSRVPFLGRPARWVRAAAATTASMSREVVTTVAAIEPRLTSFGDPAGRLAFLDSLEREFRRLREIVATVTLPETGGFMPPVDAAGRELKSDLIRLRGALSDGAAAAHGLLTFLRGPSTYSVLAANNAEMRAGGMVLQVGLLNLREGVAAAGGFRSTGGLTLKQPVTLPAEIDALYGWLDPDTEWRNVGSSPNFPAIAPVYRAMAERSGIGRVDGVLLIDVIGVRALLEVIGPVEVGGRRYDARTVERLVLHDLYGAFGGEQVERRNEFSRLAAATFQALTQRAWRPADLVAGLRRAALGRHLMAWSIRGSEQAAWERLRMDGSLERDGLMLTVQNHTGNKLDWFVGASMDLRVEERAGGWRRVHARIRIHNATPAGESRYVAGDGSIVPSGDHRALVAMYLPGWATNVEVPAHTVNIVGPDGPMRVIGTRIDVPRGGSATLEVVFSVPPRVPRLIVLPSARARPVTVRVGRWRLDDDRPRVIPI